MYGALPFQALFFVGFTYTQLIDVTNYLNHYYLVSLLALIMIFLPLHRTWSVDAWLRPRAGRPRVPQLPAEATTAVIVEHQLGVRWLTQPCRPIR